ncbi:MAG: ribosomal-processing cysteine protease Prp [Treponema sp.]|nr:ribosomal-processing cysteine protease Prp [Treponema sp.]
MITITVVLDGSGLIKTCDVRGHARAGKRGYDLVCAAVSVLVRTALSVLSKKEGISIKGGAERRGEFSLETKVQNTAGRDFLAAVGSFLIEGLKSVAEEFPQNCIMIITTEE